MVAEDDGAESVEAVVRAKSLGGWEGRDGEGLESIGAGCPLTVVGGDAGVSCALLAVMSDEALAYVEGRAATRWRISVGRGGWRRRGRKGAVVGGVVRRVGCAVWVVPGVHGWCGGARVVGVGVVGDRAPVWWLSRRTTAWVASVGAAVVRVLSVPAGGIVVTLAFQAGGGREEGVGSAVVAGARQRGMCCGTSLLVGDV